VRQLGALIKQQGKLSPDEYERQRDAIMERVRRRDEPTYVSKLAMALEPILGVGAAFVPRPEDINAPTLIGGFPAPPGRAAAAEKVGAFGEKALELTGRAAEPLMPLLAPLEEGAAPLAGIGQRQLERSTYGEGPILPLAMAKGAFEGLERVGAAIPELATNMVAMKYGFPPSMAIAAGEAVKEKALEKLPFSPETLRGGAALAELSGEDPEGNLALFEDVGLNLLNLLGLQSTRAYQAVKHFNQGRKLGAALNAAQTAEAWSPSQKLAFIQKHHPTDIAKALEHPAVKKVFKDPAQRQAILNAIPENIKDLAQVRLDEVALPGQVRQGARKRLLRQMLPETLDEVPEELQALRNHDIGLTVVKNRISRAQYDALKAEGFDVNTFGKTKAFEGQVTVVYDPVLMDSLRGSVNLFRKAGAKDAKSLVAHALRHGPEEMVPVLRNMTFPGAEGQAATISMWQKGGKKAIASRAAMPGEWGRQQHELLALGEAAKAGDESALARLHLKKPPGDLRLQMDIVEAKSPIADLTPAQLIQKLEALKVQGVPDEVAREAMREALLGNTKKAAETAQKGLAAERQLLAPHGEKAPGVTKAEGAAIKKTLSEHPGVEVAREGPPPINSAGELSGSGLTSEASVAEHMVVTPKWARGPDVPEGFVPRVQNVVSPDVEVIRPGKLAQASTGEVGGVMSTVMQGRSDFLGMLTRTGKDVSGEIQTAYFQQQAQNRDLIQRWRRILKDTPDPVERKVAMHIREFDLEKVDPALLEEIGKGVTPRAQRINAAEAEMKAITDDLFHRVYPMPEEQRNINYIRRILDPISVAEGVKEEIAKATAAFKAGRPYAEPGKVAVRIANKKELKNTIKALKQRLEVFSEGEGLGAIIGDHAFSGVPEPGFTQARTDPLMKAARYMNNPDEIFPRMIRGTTKAAYLRKTLPLYDTLIQKVKQGAVGAKPAEREIADRVVRRLQDMRRLESHPRNRLSGERLYKDLIKHNLNVGESKSRQIMEISRDLAFMGFLGMNPSSALIVNASQLPVNNIGMVGMRRAARAASIEAAKQAARKAGHIALDEVDLALEARRPGSVGTWVNDMASEAEHAFFHGEQRRVGVLGRIRDAERKALKAMAYMYNWSERQTVRFAHRMHWEHAKDTLAEYKKLRFKAQARAWAEHHGLPIVGPYYAGGVQ